MENKQMTLEKALDVMRVWIDYNVQADTWDEEDDKAYELLKEVVPELLEACELVNDFMKANDNFSDEGEEQFEFITKLNHAIAKAKGE